MGDFVYNIAKGRVAEFYNRVQSNDPANSALIIVAVKRGSATDATMKDYATLAALLGDAQVDEVTNSGYARKTLTDADLTALTVDNDTTAGTDANIIPLTNHSFAITTDGTDITATVADFYRAS